MKLCCEPTSPFGDIVVDTSTHTVTVRRPAGTTADLAFAFTFYGY